MVRGTGAASYTYLATVYTILGIRACPTRPTRPEGGPGLVPRPAQARLFVRPVGSTVLGYLIYPVVMIYDTVKLKNNLKYLPKSEAPQSVDQWSPLVAVGSVLLTVLISRMRPGVKQHREDKRIILLGQLDTLSPLVMSGTRLASGGAS